MAAHGQRVGVKNLKWRKRESLMMLYVYNQHKSWLEDSQRTVTLIEIWEEIAIKLSKMTGIERTGMQARRHYGELNQWKFKQLQEWLRQVQENPPAPFGSLPLQPRLNLFHRDANEEIPDTSGKF